MKSIQFRTSLNLQASGKQRKFRILAYTGGLLRVDGFPLPVVVDLSGLEAGAAVPLVLDHKTTSQTTVGEANHIENDGRQLVLAGIVTGTSAEVQNVLSQHDAGHTWQASIGAVVEAQEEIPEGRSVNVNGQRFSGPLIVARRAVLRETSVLPVGADGNTQVNLAAAAATIGGNSMDFTTWLNELGFDESTLTDKQRTFLEKAFAIETEGNQNTQPTAAAGAVLNLRAAVASEASRLRNIQLLTAGSPEVLAAAIEHGWDEKETEIQLLKAQIRKGHNMPNNRIQTNVTGAPDQAAVLTASLAMSCGGSPAFLAKSLGEKAVDAATSIQNRGASLRDVCEFVLKAAGSTERSNRMTDSYIRATFHASQQLEASGLSTVSLPGILGNAANKLLLEGYNSVPTSWQEWCVTGDLKDFKEATRYRMIGGGDFEEVGKGGHIKHLALTTEQTYTNQAKTYAKMVAISRQDLVNDDLGAFETIPMMLGRKAVIKLEKVVYTLLLANTGNVFSTGNSNYIEGAATNLQISSLTTAEQKFLDQTDENGDPVLIVPQVLLVPTSLSVTANQLVRDTQVVAVGVGATAATTPNGNPHAGRFTAVPTPWLNNANLTGYSSVHWYLMAKPQGKSGLMEVGFLNGQQTPTIEQGELDFSQLGIALRGFWDFGVAFGDHRFGVRSKGSA